VRENPIPCCFQVGRCGDRAHRIEQRRVGGLMPLRGDEPADLYEIIRQRYERGAMIITSNRDLSELPSLFGDPLLASAAMDRLLHHAHVVAIEGDSYRNPPPNRPARARATS
jgi:hypothetical protein